MPTNARSIRNAFNDMPAHFAGAAILRVILETWTLAKHEIWLLVLCVCFSHLTANYVDTREKFNFERLTSVRMIFFPHHLWVVLPNFSGADIYNHFNWLPRPNLIGNSLFLGRVASLSFACVSLSHAPRRNVPVYAPFASLDLDQQQIRIPKAITAEGLICGKSVCSSFGAMKLWNFTTYMRCVRNSGRNKETKIYSAYIVGACACVLVGCVVSLK